MGTVPNRSRPVRRSRLGCARVARYSIAPCSVSMSSPDDSEMPSKYLDGRAPGCNPLMSAFGLRARQRCHLPIPSWSLWLTQWVTEGSRTSNRILRSPLTWGFCPEVLSRHRDDRCTRYRSSEVDVFVVRANQRPEDTRFIVVPQPPRGCYPRTSPVRCPKWMRFPSRIGAVRPGGTSSTLPSWLVSVHFSEPRLRKPKRFGLRGCGTTSAIGVSSSRVEPTW